MCPVLEDSPDWRHVLVSLPTILLNGHATMLSLGPKHPTPEVQTGEGVWRPGLPPSESGALAALGQLKEVLMQPFRSAFEGESGDGACRVAPKIRPWVGGERDEKGPVGDWGWGFEDGRWRRGGALQGSTAGHASV